MVTVYAVSALSVTANAKSAEQISGVYEFVGPGIVSLYAKGSATGMNCTFLVAGQPVVNDQPIPYTGTAGTISRNDNGIASAQINGGRLSLTFRNTTGGTLTTDAIVDFTPTK